MSDHINGIKSRPYRKEIIDTLQKLVKGMSAYKEFVFFVKCVRDYHLADFEKGRPDLAVIGSGIPEELVLASGKRPYWILAGSRVNSMWADDADIPKEGHRKHPPGIPGCTESSAKERKTIGTLCVMVSAELVYAAGAMPVRLCSGSYTA